jgi:hypothetical protein
VTRQQIFAGDNDADLDGSESVRAPVGRAFHRDIAASANRRTARRRGRATDLRARAREPRSVSTSSSRLVSLSEASSQKTRLSARSAATRSLSPAASPVATSFTTPQSGVAAGGSRRRIT